MTPHAHRDGELQVTPLRFLGYLIGAVGIVVGTWVFCVVFLVTFS